MTLYKEAGSTASLHADTHYSRLNNTNGIKSFKSGCFSPKTSDHVIKNLGREWSINQRKSLQSMSIE